MITRYLENMGVCVCCAGLYLIAGPLWHEVREAVRIIGSVFQWMAQ